MPRLEQWEIKKYWEIFRGLKPVENKLDGEKLGPIFKNSQLSQDKLTSIWDLADIDNDGSLDFEEFCIAMRLIFDLVNGNINEVPARLPSWLIPGSKRHLVQADDDVQTGTISMNGNGAGGESDTDDEYTLSSDFDWYISPKDKSNYESIYNSSCDKYGRISFDSLDMLYKKLDNVPQTDVSSAWNIVNPKQSETIDKDQCMVYLHILNQRSNGKRIPRSIPPSLRATFNKETPEYDVDSHQTHLNSKQDRPDAFAQPKPAQSIDYTESKGEDWQEVELRRELTELEDLIRRAEEAKQNKGKDSRLDVVKYEFEQLLKYKEEQQRQLAYNPGNSGSNLSDILRNIETIDVQVSQLEDFLHSKQSELSRLNQQIEALK